MDTNQDYERTIADLHARAVDGDELCSRALAVIALCQSGWTYGDPSPAYMDDSAKRNETFRVFARDPAWAALANLHS